MRPRAAASAMLGPDDLQRANQPAIVRATFLANTGSQAWPSALRTVGTRSGSLLTASAAPPKTAWIVTLRGTGGNGVRDFVGFRATIACRLRNQ